MRLDNFKATKFSFPLTIVSRETINFLSSIAKLFYVFAYHKPVHKSIKSIKFVSFVWLSVPIKYKLRALVSDKTLKEHRKFYRRLLIAL